MTDYTWVRYLETAKFFFQFILTSVSHKIINIVRISCSSHGTWPRDPGSRVWLRSFGRGGLDHSQGKWFAPGEALPPGFIITAHPEGHTAPQEGHMMTDKARWHVLKNLYAQEYIYICNVMFMFMFMLCIYVCMYKHTHTHVHMYIQTHISVYTSTS